MTQAGAGISAAGPLWREFMVRSLEKFPVDAFNKPDPVFSNKIMLNGDYFYRPAENQPPEIHNILYYVDRKNPLGPFPENPEKDMQFKNWEWAVETSD